MVTYIISKQHRQSQLLIVWQNMTENAGRISVLPEKREIHHIIPTALICQWNIPPIFLTHSTYRMNFRPFILPVFHAFLGEKLPDWKAAASLVRKIAENYKLPYYTLSPTYSVCKTHGYIAGEHFICPKCGEKAEVYSRITGYYRPVQNWNDGKSQEYKNRTVYDILHSNLKAKPAEQKLEQEQPVKTEQETVVETAKEEKYLFTTATCPNCKIAKKMLEGEEYQVIDADQNPEMVRKFGIMQAPTLVVFDGDKMHKYVNASNIQRYVDQM